MGSISKLSSPPSSSPPAPPTSGSITAPSSARSRADSQSRSQEPALPPRSSSRPSLLPSPRTATEAEDRLDTLIKSLQKGEEQLSSASKGSPERGQQGQLPNNQAPVLPSRPLPAESYKNNLLKAKAEEDKRADLKNCELSTSNDLSAVISPRKNPNIATGDSPSKEVGDKASATFVSVGGDKLTLNLGCLSQTEVLTTKLIEVESPPPASTPSNLELLSSLTIDLPVSVTHFSSNGQAGVQRETLFSDLPSAEQCSTVSSSTTNPFTQNFVPPSTSSSFLPTPSPNSTFTSSPGQANNPFAGQKFATIGRSNPFSSPTKSKNPFLDPVVPSNNVPAVDSPMSTGSPNNSPETSLEPAPLIEARLLSKIETSFAGTAPVTRSLSSVGKRPGGQSSSRLPVLATNLPKSNSVNNKNSINNKLTNGDNRMLTNGTNSNLINNNEAIKNTNSKANTSLDDISPWLVTDSLTVKKKESKIPIMKTVITTEL